MLRCPLIVQIPESRADRMSPVRRLTPTDGDNARGHQRHGVSHVALNPAVAAFARQDTLPSARMILTMIPSGSPLAAG
jgi:hypothetical protein